MKHTCALLFAILTNAGIVVADPHDAPLVSLQGGQIPIGAAQTQWQQWQSSPLTSTLILDGVVSTGVTVPTASHGGAFMVLDFAVPTDAVEIRLHVLAESRSGQTTDANHVVYGAQPNPFCCHAGETIAIMGIESTALEISDFRATFTTTGNVIGSDRTQYVTDLSDRTIESFRIPGGLFRFIVYGPYLSGAPDGQPLGRLTIYEASLAYEPLGTIYCPGDFNLSGAVGVQDLFDFLAAYFAGEFGADFNHSMTVTVQDIFDFLAAYFSGCP